LDRLAHGTLRETEGRTHRLRRLAQPRHRSRTGEISRLLHDEAGRLRRLLERLSIRHGARDLLRSRHEEIELLLTPQLLLYPIVLGLKGGLASLGERVEERHIVGIRSVYQVARLARSGRERPRAHTRDVLPFVRQRFMLDGDGLEGLEPERLRDL